MRITHSGRRGVTAVLAALLLATGLSVPAEPAAASAADGAPGATTYPVAWAPIGIYPRSGTTWDSPHAGPALPNGTLVQVACEEEGQSVTSAAGTSTIWDRLASPAGYLPNVFVGTRASSWTPGVPRCADFDAAAAADTGVGIDDGTGAETPCGAWWPGDGAMRVTSARPLGDSASIEFTATFRFSQERLEALRCTGDIAIEVEAIVNGVAAKSGTVGFSSTLPGAYDDTEYLDDPDNRNLAMGTTHLVDLRPDTDYTVDLVVTDPVFDAATATVWLNFQRGHWARWNDIYEFPACIRGHGTDSWCVFSSETARMQDHGLSTLEIPLDANTAAAAAAAWTSTTG